MLEFGGMGMIREIKFKIDYANDSRRAAIVVDELNNVLWVWYGNMVRPKVKNQLDSVIEKIRAGYKTKDNIEVGKNCQTTVIIDQKNLEDPVVAENYQKLLSIFNYPMQEVGKYVMDVNVPQQSQAPMMDMGTASPRDQAIAGMLIASIIEKHPEVMIGKNARGEYIIESDRKLLNFKVVNGTVQLLPGSPNLPEDITRIFTELYNLIS
jgi:hypothetical protein